MERIPAIDLLKLVVATAVVWAHSVLLGGHYSAVTYLFGQGIVRNAVPAFALISGFLFHSTYARGNTKRWVATLACAYLFWALVYLPIWLRGTDGMAEALGLLIFGPIHLWYMAALVLAIGVLTLALRLLPEGQTGRRWLLGLAIAALVTGNALQALDFFTAIDVPLNGYRNGVLLEFPYAAFGYLLADRLKRRGLNSLPSASTLWLILGGLALLRLGEAYLSLKFAGLSPAAPPEFLPLAVGFVVILFLAIIRSPLPPLPQSLGMMTMFIYFLHYLVLLVVLYLGLNHLWLLLIAGVALPSLAALVLLRLLREPILPRLLRAAAPSRWHL